MSFRISGRCVLRTKVSAPHRPLFYRLFFLDFIQPAQEIVNFRWRKGKGRHRRVADDDPFGERFREVLYGPFPTEITKRGCAVDRTAAGAANGMATGTARLGECLPGLNIRCFESPGPDRPRNEGARRQKTGKHPGTDHGADKCADRYPVKRGQAFHGGKFAERLKPDHRNVFVRAGETHAQRRRGLNLRVNLSQGNLLTSDIKIDLDQVGSVRV